MAERKEQIEEVGQVSKQEAAKNSYTASKMLRVAGIERGSSLGQGGWANEHCLHGPLLGNIFPTAWQKKRHIK